jgi:hypothetical protein
MEWEFCINYSSWERKVENYRGVAALTEQLDLKEKN